MLLTAMRWLYRKKIAVFENLGYSWEDLLDHFKVGMAKSIASFHVALAVPESVVRAYVKLIRYVFTSYLPRDVYTTSRSIFSRIWDLFSSPMCRTDCTIYIPVSSLCNEHYSRVLIRSWPLYERKRALALITCSERKIAGRRALAIRQSEKRFKTLSHIKMEMVKKTVVIASIGGLADQDCTAFLSDRSEDDEVELGVNSQRHLALVVPFTALKSHDISDFTECKYLTAKQLYTFILQILVLNVELPSGVVDLELPSGLTTLLSTSDDSIAGPRNSTAVDDPAGHFDGMDVEEVPVSLVGILCTCGRLFAT